MTKAWGKTRIAGLFGAALLCVAIANGQTAAAQQPQGNAKAEVQLDAKTVAAIPMGANGKPLKFDVVSFRRTEKPGTTRVDMPATGDFIAYHGQPVSRLIYFAYFLTSGPKMIDVPDWADNDLYEFQAKVAAEDVAIWQRTDLSSRRLIMRALLANVLKLKVHPNDKTESVYEMVVLPGGPKLTEYVEGQDKKFPNGKVMSGTSKYWITPVDTYFHANTMSQLAEALSVYHTTNRDVIDKTGLNGKYDFELPVPTGPITPEMLEKMPPEVQDQYHTESIFKALEKVGLKLQPGKATSPGVVIEHIEKPEEN